jgi:hypothetical protein
MSAGRTDHRARGSGISITRDGARGVVHSMYLEDLGSSLTFKDSPDAKELLASARNPTTEVAKISITTAAAE